MDVEQDDDCSLPNELPIHSPFPKNTGWATTTIPKRKDAKEPANPSLSEEQKSHLGSKKQHHAEVLLRRDEKKTNS